MRDGVKTGTFVPATLEVMDTEGDGSGKVILRYRQCPVCGFYAETREELRVA